MFKLFLNFWSLCDFTVKMKIKKQNNINQYLGYVYPGTFDSLVLF